MVHKKYIENLINRNPVEIILIRIIKTDNGFKGYTETPKTLPKQTVTFYKKRISRSTVTDTGEAYSSQIVAKVLCYGDADILKGDTFTSDGTTYRVANVEPYEGICKQAELEVIK